MKNIVRAFVVALALTGFAASTQITNTASTSSKVTMAKVSAAPVPSCPPDDPNACGMKGW
ncbi:hypothetical protein GCM10011507_20710 [Edaphobacter acidisoli]|uniref:Uncharacterized protein n=1 Tax=Edaphobacter acidisoli TaxID=2040573 RepID=A0A916RW41_9BACT|nr:hypothetical protein [Edaphobacter acidisoli]GGA69079.1 hypothetical protein GCM10011507_20710 [Edaphobacter acidisoli]